MHTLSCANETSCGLWLEKLSEYMPLAVYLSDRKWQLHPLPGFIDIRIYQRTYSVSCKNRRKNSCKVSTCSRCKPCFRSVPCRQRVACRTSRAAQSLRRSGISILAGTPLLALRPWSAMRLDYCRCFLDHLYVRHALLSPPFHGPFRCCPKHLVVKPRSTCPNASEDCRSPYNLHTFPELLRHSPFNPKA